MRKELITLVKSFFEAYRNLKTDLERLDLTVDELVFSDEPVLKDTILQHIQDAEIYILGVEKVDREIYEAAKKLKYIAKHGAGLDNIDLKEAIKRKILITYTPGQNSS